MVISARAQAPLGHAIPRSSASHFYPTGSDRAHPGREAELRQKAFPSGAWERVIGRLFFLLVFSSCSLCLCGETFAADWVHWRGPEQTGVSREVDLPDRWSPNPKAANNNLIWTQPYGGRSTPLVMNGRVYIIHDAGE